MPVGGKISQRGADLIERFEGRTPYAYDDPVGFCTAGPGVLQHRSRCTAADYAKYGTRAHPKISQSAYALMFARKLAPVKDAINSLVRVPLNQNEFDALASFVYNVGVGAFRSSTLLRLLNAGKRQAAAAEFDRWTRAGGRVLPGLVRRRDAEQALFLTPVPTHPPRKLTRRQRLVRTYHRRRHAVRHGRPVLRAYLFSKARLGLWDSRYCKYYGVPCNVTPTLRRVLTKGFALGLVPTATSNGQHAPNSYHGQRDPQGRVKALDMGNRTDKIGTQAGLRRMQAHQRWLFDHYRELGLAEVIGPINDKCVLAGRPVTLAEGSDLEQMHDTHTHSGDPT